MSTPMAQSFDALAQLAVGAQAHTYTYLFCDLVTDQVIAELPLQQVTYETILSGIGTLRAFVPLNAETAPLDPIGSTVGGRTVLYVDRDGVIVWSGIVWTRQLAAGGFTIQAAEFLSYYQRRFIRDTISTNPANVTDTRFIPDGNLIYGDQKFALWSLFQYAGSRPGGNVLVSTNLLVGVADGVSRDLTYYGYERPEIYATMQQLSQADDGFDFAVECGWNPIVNNLPPTRYRRARSWYPQRGRSAADSGLVFSKGGPSASIVDYDWPEDFTAVATQTWALGDGQGESRIIAGATDSDLLMAGWPLLEAVQSYDGVTQATRAQGYANADLNARSGAAVAPTFTVLADADPVLGTYEVGDAALFSIAPEPRWPDGMDAELRILGMQVTASSPELVHLACAGV
jgi:hypothetical protein